HDLCYTLQVHCHDRIIQERRRFPQDDDAFENVKHHKLDMDRNLARLDHIGEQCGELAQLVSQLRDQLGNARANLQNALESDDHNEVSEGIGGLGRFLLTEASLINTRLTTAATNLDLPRFVRTMQQLRQTLEDLKLDGDDVRKLAADVETLVALEPRLR